jgi:hypothetical protein
VARAGAALCFLLPFGLTLAYYLARDRPGTGFNYLCDYAAAQPFQPQVPRIPERSDSLGDRLGRAWWLMSGAQYRDAPSPTTAALRGATGYYLSRLALYDLSLLAWAPIAIAVRRWRERSGMVAAALLLWVGNSFIYLVSPAWDAYTFTLPGLIGLTLLVAVGCDRLSALAPAELRRGAAALCFLPAGLLAASNFHANNGADPRRLYRECVAAQPDPTAMTEPAFQRRAVDDLLRDHVPPRARLFTPFVTGRGIQCRLRLEQRRTDVDVFVCDDERVWKAYWLANPDDRPALAAGEAGWTAMSLFEPASP